MVRRRFLLLAWVAALAGCQGYNFNPVGKCVVQPGSSRFTLNQVSTADILFVVDDSGSMQSQQESLARNFGAFIDELALTQRDRAQRGLIPLDFHVAITTSAIYENLPAQGGATCSAGSAGLQCEYRSFIDGSLESYACTTPSAACGELISEYWGFTSSHRGCTPGFGISDPAAIAGRRYPQGDFVGAPGNPRVLHFTKDLDWASWGGSAPDARLATLVRQFQENIRVGTCGSGEEQHLEAARLALQKALRRDGLAQPEVPRAEFPHDGAKLVVVFVGDEDDCSAPADPQKAVLMGTVGGIDACVADSREPDPALRKQFPVSEYASFLLGLERPLGAAFIYSSFCTVGPDGTRTCQPGHCSCPPPSGEDCATCPQPGVCSSCPAVDPQCSGKSDGTRLKELSNALAGSGVATVEASVCDYSFARTLKSIAELVKPPAGLRLPTQPAATEVSVLRIVGTDGRTTRVCRGPSADADWWFVGCEDGEPAAPGITTSCIAIRPASSCEANPGETYSAEYLGIVPAGGCGAAAPQSSECAQLLGGRAQDWSCEIAPGQLRGTCLCNGS